MCNKNSFHIFKDNSRVFTVSQTVLVNLKDSELLKFKYKIGPHFFLFLDLQWFYTDLLKIKFESVSPLSPTQACNFLRVKIRLKNIHLVDQDEWFVTQFTRLAKITSSSGYLSCTAPQYTTDFWSGDIFCVLNLYKLIQSSEVNWKTNFEPDNITQSHPISAAWLQGLTEHFLLGVCCSSRFSHISDGLFLQFKISNTTKALKYLVCDSEVTGSGPDVMSTNNHIQNICHIFQALMQRISVFEKKTMIFLLLGFYDTFCTD